MIRGQRTNLRAVERHDAGDLYDLLNDEETLLGWGMGWRRPILGPHPGRD
jgi:hypothetical protein